MVCKEMTVASETNWTTMAV